MDQNFEIEFKNLLMEQEYYRVLGNEWPESVEHNKIVFTYQTNHYFDTIEQDLKKQHSALRIRVTDFYNELTLKVPHEGFLMETNFHLSDNDISEIINTNQLLLSSLISSMDKFPFPDNIDKDTIFYLFNSFKTKRVEKRVENHLLVLDETTFQNGFVDYELEVESTDAIEGKIFFDSFLEINDIPIRKSRPKIQRAEENK